LSVTTVPTKGSATGFPGNNTAAFMLIN
jgi:hypothetical protein